MSGDGHAGWLVRPSLWFDAVCLVPLLAELDFYVSRHAGDAALWQRRFADTAGPASLRAVTVLRQEVTERAGKPLSAFLALWTSPAAGQASSSAPLEGLIAAVREPDLLPAAMRERSDHWSAADDQLFHRVQPAVASVLAGLQAAGLPEWWQEQAEPQLQRRCQALIQELAPYDLAPFVERARAALPSRPVELCVLRPLPGTHVPSGQCFLSESGAGRSLSRRRRYRPYRERSAGQPPSRSAGPAPTVR